MNATTDVVQIVGWALIHFVWQGALLAAVAAGALRLCRDRPANTRYLVACAALLALLAAPLATGAILSRSATPPATVGGVTTARVAAVPIGATPSAGPETSSGSLHAVWSGVDRLAPVVVVVWLTGVAVLLVRMAGGVWQVRRLQLEALAAPASTWMAAGRSLALRLGLHRAVHVAETTRVATPTVVGWLRPVILLPVAALAHLTPAQVEAILVHELAHIRRHDFAVNVAQTLAETLLFYHPAVWWLSDRMRTEREHCCDDVAVAACGDAVGYAEALATLAGGQGAATMLAPAATGTPLLGRVHRLLGAPVAHDRRPLDAVVVGALALALVMGGAVAGLPWLAGDPAAVGAAVAQDDGPIASPDTFDWRIRVTDHFELHHYPALDGDLEPIETAAEEAYARLSAELDYQLPFRVPVVLYKTRDDFRQQQIAPGATDTDTVNAFSEPRRNRIVILVEDGTEVAQLLVHELTHIFMFDLVPRDPEIRVVPVWLDEGLANYMAGVWRPVDLASLRGVLTAGDVPRMRTLDTPDLFENPRVPYLLGHAMFDFIEATYGKPRVRQFLIELRRDVVDRTGDLYQAALNLTPDEFDTAFERYLRQRFGV